MWLCVSGEIVMNETIPYFDFWVLAKVPSCYITASVVKSAKQRSYFKTPSQWNIIGINGAAVCRVSFGCIFSLWTLCREARIRDVCRMWKSDPWPVHTESLSRSGVARSLSKVCGVQPVLGWDLYLFRPGRQNLLQKRLCKVGLKKIP